MKTLIIGHRGVGKTAFLGRVKLYYQEEQRPIETYDLDHYIENKAHAKIPDIFAKHGEAAFRKLESEAFAELSVRAQQSTSDVYLSVGAGFQIPPEHDWKCLWIRRSTDATGRIFLNRPRLDQSVDPLTEFQERFKIREKNYQAWAHEILTLQEGFDYRTEAEKAWVLNQIHNVGGALTVDPQAVATNSLLKEYFERRKNWGVKWFELRDDLLSNEQIETICKTQETDTLLLSFRRTENIEAAKALQSRYNLQFDWPLEWGAKAPKSPTVLSYHQRDEDLSRTLQNVEQAAQIYPSSLLKVAFPVQNFAELNQGHQWQQKEKTRRSFLPMSETGRWRWYRTMMKEQMPLQFFREGAGSAKDQPYLLEWLRQPTNLTGFSAVLGDPVEHSRTPGEQYKFFHARSMSVVAIQMNVAEAHTGALEVLGAMGLKCASVTSPLKEWVFQISEAQDDLTRKLEATNTLYYDSKQAAWLGTNTDLFGFKEALEKNISDVSKHKYVIWGGGGTLEMLREVLPATTIAYSAQTGKPRQGETLSFQDSPDVVVWAVGRKNWEGSRILPPSQWKPKWILDLNYSEDSPGLEYAQISGARYINGLEMFRAQALGQRQFWEKKF